MGEDKTLEELRADLTELQDCPAKPPCASCAHVIKESVALFDHYAQDRQTEAVKAFAEKVKQSLVNSIAKSDNWDYEDIYRLVDRQVKAHLQRECICSKDDWATVPKKFNPKCPQHGEGKS